MRLAAKLILLYLFGLAMIVGVFTYLTIQNQRRTAALAHGQQASQLVAALRPLIDRALIAGDEEMIRQHLRASSRQLNAATLRFISPPVPPSKTRGRLGPGGYDHRPRAQLDRIQTFVRSSPTGMRMVSSVPIQLQNRPAGTIQIDTVDALATANLRQAAMTAAMALCSVTFLSSIVIFFGALYLVGRPLRELIARVQSIAEGDFASPATPACVRRLGGRDELGQLGRAIEFMRDKLQQNRQRIESETASRIAAQQQLWHADRLGTVGRLAAGLAHEVGTPLAVVSGRAELIQQGQLAPEDVRRNASIIRQQSDRIAVIVRQLLGFARPGGQGGDRVQTSVTSLVGETIELVESLVRRRSVEITADGDDCDVVVDRSQFQQVLTNLIANAVDAGAATIDIRWRCQNDILHLSVRDDGQGMDPETADHLFEPFYTTKDVGCGTGLGLSIAYGIVEDHGGTIRVESHPGRGTTFEIQLPRRSS